LAVATSEGRVISSGHLAGRAGDLDPEIQSLFVELGPGAATARFVSCATPAGVKPTLALVAWESIAGGLRVVAGIALGPAFAERLSTLTGGNVTLVDEKTTQPLASSAPDQVMLSRIYSWFLEAPEGRVQAIPIGAGEKALARIEVSLSAAGLARAGNTVALAFLSALALAVVAATFFGHLLARRITRPLEALRRGALQVASGDLSPRVAIRATGEVGDLVGAFNSMTEDLASSRIRAAAAERVAAWREVARRLAHEIKNPLTPIAMSVATLRDAFESNRADFREIFQEGTGAIQEEVSRLKRIVDEFSRFARLPRPELAPVDAEELIASFLARYPAPPAGIQIERDVAPSLPKVNLDRDQMLQVLLNLASNALEAMGSAGGVLRVTARSEGSEVAFSLSDTGPGISPQNLSSIFEPYFTTKEGGTGLGLAIVNRIVSEHGGRIDVDSKEG
jgi:signal transduction histidine kinase